MHWYTCKCLLNTLGRAVEQLAGCLPRKQKSVVKVKVQHSCNAKLVWFPDPSCMGGAREGRKGLVNNSTPTRIHGYIPAVSIDEGKRKYQVGVSRE